MNGGNTQISLGLSLSHAGLTQAIEVIKTYRSFEKHFADVRAARVITFCDSPEMIRDTFAGHDLERLEIIVGDQTRDDYRSKLVGKPDLADELEQLKQEGRLHIYLRRKLPRIHIKLYILRLDHDRFRILHGSPNFSRQAWGRQHESVTVFETEKGTDLYDEFDRVWQEEKADCEKFLDDLTLEIERTEELRDVVIARWVQGKAADLEIDEQQEIQRRVVTELIEPVSEYGDESGDEIRLSLQNFDPKIQKQIRDAYSHADISYDSHNQVLRGSRSAFAVQHHRAFGVPIMHVTSDAVKYVSRSDGQSVEMSSPWPDPAEVRGGLQHIHRYLDTVDKYAFCSNPRLVKMHMYEALLYIFWAPFINRYAEALEQKDNMPKDKSLPFLFIHGEPGAGKSTFLRFALRLISDGRVTDPAAAEDITTTRIRALKHMITSFPFMADDVQKRKIEESKDALTGYWATWKPDTPYPALVFTSNDSKPKDWFRGRAKIVEFELLYQGSRESQHNAIILQKEPNDIFSWYAHRHLELIREHGADLALDDDVLGQVRKVFIELYRYASLEVPPFFPCRAAEEVHDPGLQKWKDFDRKQHFVMRPDTEPNSLVVEFTPSFETWEIERLRSDLPSVIRHERRGSTIKIKNADTFREWYGDSHKVSLLERMRDYFHFR